jgi:hypothetical protein
MGQYLQRREKLVAESNRESWKVVAVLKVVHVIVVDMDPNTRDSGHLRIGETVIDSEMHVPVLPLKFIEGEREETSFCVYLVASYQ